LGKPGTVDRAIEDAKQRAVAVIEACGLSLEDAEEIQEHIGSLFDARDEEMPAEIDQVRQFAGALGAPVRELGFSRTELDRPRSARGAIASSSRPRRVAKRTEKNPEQSPATSEPATTPPPREERDRSEDLLFFNGYGGFAKAGNEYVIPISRRESGGLQLPPRPWINVLANERFGCLVSETGAGMTWSENSREYRLTPWANDPLCDPHSEALYIRDEESGAFWSPLPGPAPGSGRYEARHGFGISTFVHTGADFEEKTEIFVPRRDSVKITSIRIRNRSGRARTLSFISFARLVLGSDTRASAPFLSIEEGPYEGSLFATSERSGDFAGRTAFAGFATQAHVRAAHVSGDREGFAGRRETLAHPRALAPGSTLDGIVGSDLDPCFAQQIVLELAAGEEAVVSFLLGDGADANESEALLNQYSDPNTLQSERDAAIAEWDARLSAIHLETPSPALDLLMNGWLMHQVLACRMRGRSALYQSGGAYGFRDQLQDSSSLALVHPEITRRQILLHAAHQFPEGDVLHWWHPPQSRGIRTRFADDLLWLPYLTAEYVRTTGDEELLDERARFVAAPLLDAGEDERYLLPKDSGTNASVFEHCLRAIDRALPRKGAHRLPLFGSGDWNDGMNRVGHAGRGESVWMGFFLVSVLDAFAPLCERRGDVERAKRYRAERAALQDALNDAGWDGEWYRRGYYDGGEPLGSAQSDECRIDALAQAWAVLSRAAPPERSSQAMRSVERHLLSEEEGLIRLLTPAFRDTPLDPGYIKGYTAGVRENGGQYTHAALWVVAAFAELGRNDRVAPLLDLLNPIHHARTADEVHRYQVEPYVIAADVYGEAPHVGRGGWTWYTGSAGWMIRVAMESLLGIRVEGGNTLTIRPCIPDEWPGFNVRLRLSPEQTVLRIHAANPDRRARTVIRATIDGRSAPVESGTARVPLARDGGEHDIEIVLGDADDGPSPAGRMSIA
jgi:cyclic beta-1,2-glucan synthetase